MHRIEVYPKRYLPDTKGLGLVKEVIDLGITAVSDIRVVDIYWLDADLTDDELELIDLQGPEEPEPIPAAADATASHLDYQRQITRLHWNVFAESLSRPPAGDAEEGED